MVYIREFKEFVKRQNSSTSDNQLGGILIAIKNRRWT